MSDPPVGDPVNSQRWTYDLNTGAMTDPNGNVVECGYSGAQPYVNDPYAMWREDQGPLPIGNYTIQPAYDHENLGPCSMPLDPNPNNIMFGRDAFYIHGDTQDMNQTASTGCIILSRPTRDLINASPVRSLEVVR